VDSSAMRCVLRGAPSLTPYITTCTLASVPALGSSLVNTAHAPNVPIQTIAVSEGARASALARKHFTLNSFGIIHSPLVSVFQQRVRWKAKNASPPHRRERMGSSTLQTLE
jgi:hypothetical protein